MESLDVRTGPSAVLVIRRLGVCLGFVLLVLMLPPLVDEDALRAVIPGFVALLFLQLAPVLLSRDPDLFEPPVYSGVMSGFATMSIMAYYFLSGRLEFDLVKGLTSDEAVDLATTTLWASSLGMICYYAGYYSSWGRGLIRLFPAHRPHDWNPTKLTIAAAALLGLFAVTYLIFQVRVGVGLFEVTNLAAGKAVWRDDPTMSWMLRGVQLGAVPLFFYFAFAASRRQDTRMVFWLGGLLLMGVLMLRVGQRGFLFIPLLVGLVTFHFLRKRVPAWGFALALLVGTSFNTVMLEWRTGRPAGTPQSLAEITDEPVRAIAGHEDDRQRFSALALLFHEFPERHDYLLGESWLGILATPIPRWIWPEKGEHFRWRDTQIVENLTGAPIPSSYLGVLYANFSWLGIVLGMFVWGLFQRGLYEWLLSAPRDPSRVILYAILLLFFGFTLIQISSTMQYLVPVWLMYRFATKRRAPEADAQAV